jgi:hypothetical protein
MVDCESLVPGSESESFSLVTAGGLGRTMTVDDSGLDGEDIIWCVLVLRDRRKTLSPTR